MADIFLYKDKEFKFNLTKMFGNYTAEYIYRKYKINRELGINNIRYLFNRINLDGAIIFKE